MYLWCFMIVVFVVDFTSYYLFQFSVCLNITVDSAVLLLQLSRRAFFYPKNISSHILMKSHMTRK
jgi:hypothetical protein